MDSNVPIEKPKRRLSSALVILGVEVVVILTIIISTIFTLNYFHVLSLSDTSLLSFMPQRQEVAEQESEVVVDEGNGEAALPIKSSFFLCPIENYDCGLGGKAVFDDQTNIVGFAYRNLPFGSRILSMRSGIAEISQEERRVIVTITGQDDIESEYTFSGSSDIVAGEEVEQGDIIGVLDDGVVATPFSNQEFSLYVTTINTVLNQVIPVIPDKDEGLVIYGAR